ncbi:hypothetical protein [Sporofaciens sp. JLR.KK001]|uniref:hypothetical protein n=1 Tax=Sporofaciens sp. JLR.KK001 TaxID=3112621 RepID=UPI002FF216D4
MKKITVYDLFLVFAIILNAGAGRNVYTSIILLCAGVLELVDVIPKIVRLMKHGGK